MGYKSIVTMRYECFTNAGDIDDYGKCSGNLEWHHIWHGTANRKLSDKDGLTCWLCAKHHKMLHDQGGAGRKLDKELMEFAEACWITENKSNKDEFRKRYGKNVI